MDCRFPATRWKFTVHAELAMIIAIVKGDINDVTKQKIATKGSHGKAYPGCLESLDRELRPAFLKRIKRQLLSDFEQNLISWSRRTDSSIGSDGTRWEFAFRTQTCVFAYSYLRNISIYRSSMTRPLLYDTLYHNTTHWEAQ